MEKDFGKEAPFQRSDKDDLSNPYGQHMGPSQLDRIEQMLTLLLGAPAPTGVGRSTPAAGCAEPSATPSRNPSADLGLAKEYRDGGGKELDVYLFKKGLDELGDRLMELWTKPKLTSGPPIPEGSISYKMRFVDADGEPIKGEPRVFLDPEQPTR